MAEKKKKMVYTVEQEGTDNNGNGVIEVFDNVKAAEEYVKQHYPDADLTETDEYQRYEQEGDFDILINGWYLKKKWDE